MLTNPTYEDLNQLDLDLEEIYRVCEADYHNIKFGTPTYALHERFDSGMDWQTIYEGVCLPCVPFTYESPNGGLREGVYLLGKPGEEFEADWYFVDNNKKVAKSGKFPILSASYRIATPLEILKHRLIVRMYESQV